MNVLDFISGSPRTFIFQKGSNKTNLGGVLTFIYLIILLVIIVAYLYDYFTHDKYDYSYFYKYLLNESSKEKIRSEEPEYNHPINISFAIYDEKKTPILPNYFKITYYLKHAFGELEPGKNITLNVADFDYLNVMIDYNDNPYPYPDLKNNSNLSSYYLNVFYSTKVIDNDNEETPVVDATFSYNCSFSLENIVKLDAKWGVYHYEEKKGIISRVSDSILNKQNQYIFGRIEKIETLAVPNIPEIKIIDSLIVFRINNPLEGIHLYKRSSVSIWDYLANIAALGTTIFNGLCKIFSLLYSKNFDNYKIIDKILSKEIKKVKNIELNNNNSQSKSSLEKNLIDKENSNRNYSINEDILINDLDNIDENNLENEDEKMITKLPKLRFFDFFFNNIYSKCCVYIKRQKLIDSCDNILYKYYSIENILYNQILFENLIKDYHWNNPDLKSIHKNELIISLNKYIS